LKAHIIDRAEDLLYSNELYGCSITCIKKSRRHCKNNVGSFWYCVETMLFWQHLNFVDDSLTSIALSLATDVTPVSKECTRQRIFRHVKSFGKLHFVLCLYICGNYFMWTVHSYVPQVILIFIHHRHSAVRIFACRIYCRV